MTTDNVLNKFGEAGITVEEAFDFIGDHELLERSESWWRRKIGEQMFPILKLWGLGCSCPRYDDGVTWDGHICELFGVLDEITGNKDVSDEIEVRARHNGMD